MEIFIGFAIIIFAIFFYFLPTYFANARQHQSKTAIFIVNLFLGWTLIGWVGALAWSFTGISTEDAGLFKCPDCAETIKRDAKVCKHCGYRLTSIVK